MKGERLSMTKTYTSISGDEWDGICYKFYGDGGEKFMGEVMKANPQHINLAVFPAGIILNMPEINMVQETQNKPPWMR